MKNTSIKNSLLCLLAKALAWPWVAKLLIFAATKRPYYHIYSDDGSEIYMERYWLFNPFQRETGKPRWPWLPSIRIHRIRRPDHDRHCHDHPYRCRTFILEGGYTEVRLQSVMDEIAEYRVTREAGDTSSLTWGGFGSIGDGQGRCFWPDIEAFHRIEEIHDCPEGGVWTMFVTGKYLGPWGFLDLDEGIPEKIRSRDYLNPHGMFWGRKSRQPGIRVPRQALEFQVAQPVSSTGRFLPTGPNAYESAVSLPEIAEVKYESVAKQLVEQVRQRRVKLGRIVQACITEENPEKCGGDVEDLSRVLGTAYSEDLPPAGRDAIPNGVITQVDGENNNADPRWWRGDNEYPY